MDLFGRVVDVYRNLHRGCWSVRRRGVPVSHQDTLTLIGAVFRVSEPGRQRVLRERQKNVHAVVRGTLVERDVGSDLLEVSYNPYRGPTFYFVSTGEPIYAAPVVYFSQGRVWVERNSQHDQHERAGP